jgi:hypothetical protein
MSMLGSLLELEERREDRVDFRTVNGLPFLNQAEAPWKEGSAALPSCPRRRASRAF